MPFEMVPYISMTTLGPSIERFTRHVPGLWFIRRPAPAAGLRTLTCIGRASTTRNGAAGSAGRRRKPNERLENQRRRDRVLGFLS